MNDIYRKISVSTYYEFTEELYGEYVHFLSHHLPEEIFKQVVAGETHIEWNSVQDSGFKAVTVIEVLP